MFKFFWLKLSGVIDFIILYKSTNAKIVKEGEEITLNIQNQYYKFPLDSYLVTQNKFVFRTEDGSLHLFFNNSYYAVTFNSENEIKEYINQNSLPIEAQQIQFKDYIMSNELSASLLEMDRMCVVGKSEAIFYGKKEENVCLFFL